MIWFMFWQLLLSTKFSKDLVCDETTNERDLQSFFFFFFFLRTFHFQGFLTNIKVSTYKFLLKRTKLNKSTLWSIKIKLNHKFPTMNQSSMSNYNDNWLQNNGGLDFATCQHLLSKWKESSPQLVTKTNM